MKEEFDRECVRYAIHDFYEWLKSECDTLPPTDEFGRGMDRARERIKERFECDSQLTATPDMFEDLCPIKRGRKELKDNGSSNTTEA